MKRRRFLELGSLAAAGFLSSGNSAPAVSGQAPRNWKVFIFNASHADIGWHDLPAEIMERTLGFLDRTIELCNQTREAPDRLQFVCTIEHAWIVDYYGRRRPPEKFEALLDCIRRGQIDVGAFYTSVHTDLCGHEELARLCFYAARLRRQHHLPIHYAMLNDASEGFTMGLPQLLAKNDIRGVTFGPGVKVVWKGIAPRIPRILHWETVDGSRVLLAWTPGKWTYTKFSSAGMKGKQTLDEFEQMADYPYDAIFRHGGRGDIQPSDPGLLDDVRKFRQECPGAVIHLSTMAEFFSYMEENFGNRIPVMRGDNPHSWADGTNSLARETGLHKRNQHEILAAEALAALFPAGGYPGGKIREAYNLMHLYSDHTWGYDFNPDGRPGEIRRVRRATTFQGTIELKIPEGQQLDVDSEFFVPYKKHWQAKKDYAYQAQNIIAGIREEHWRELCRRIAVPRESVVVWNPMSYRRSDIVRVPWKPDAIPAEMTDVRSGKAAPCQWEAGEGGGGFLVFAAADLPGLGYSRFEPSRDLRPAAEPRADSATVIENTFYRVRVDEKTGTILSILDKELQRDIVDGSAPYTFNQYIHNDVNAGFIGTGVAEKAGITYGEGTRYTPNILDRVECRPGPVYSCFESLARLTAGPAPATIRRTVRVYHLQKKIEVVNRVEKRESLYKEQIYIAFPFSLGCRPSLQIELPYAVLDWDRDIFPGSWRGYSSVQNFVRLTGGDRTVVWSSPEVPVATFGGLNSNHYDPEWHDTFVPANAQIYSYAMSNMWNCNYALFQGGSLRLPYAFTSGAQIPLAESTRFGWNAAHPLLACVLGPQAGTLPADSYSAVELDSGSVMVTALKQAEDGQGWILRLYETGRNPETTIRVKVNFREIRKAILCRISEEDLKEIPTDGRTIPVTLRANELVSIRIL